MKGSRFLNVALLATAGFLLACFSEHLETTGPNGDLCDAPSENVVRIRNFSFQPQQLTVAAGTEVTWVNCDADIHTSTSDAAGLWNSGSLSQNATFTRRFDQTGEFPYHCQPHASSMRAQITVQ